MEVITLKLLESLPAYSSAAETTYLNALDRLEHAPPTSVHPTARADLLRWLVGGLDRGEWSAGVSLRAVQAIKGLGRNPLGSEVLATRQALETLVRCAALPTSTLPLSSSASGSPPRPPTTPGSSSSPRSMSPTQRIASFLSRSSSPPLRAAGATRKFGDPISDEALRVLANVSLLHAPAREILADLGAGQGIVDGLRILNQAEGKGKDRGDFVFVGARILFLLTVAGGPALLKLVEESDVPSLIIAILSDAPRIQAFDPLPELLKLSYNVLSLYPRLSAARVRLDESGGVWDGIEEEPVASGKGGMGEWWDDRLTPLLQPILAILAAQTPPSSLPLPPTLSQALACLLPFPSSTFAPLLNQAHADRLLAIWQCASSPFSHPTDRPSSDQAVEREMPVLALVLARLTGVEQFKRELVTLFFPDDLDRSADSTPLQDRPDHLGRAIRLLLAPSDMTQTRSAVGELLFALSDRDPNRMCDLVGYGNAAGFLLTKGFSSPSTSSAPVSHPDQTPSGFRASSSARSAPKAKTVNPITALESDPSVPTHDPTMTDADKEREAERLFVLFDRIRKNPVVSLGDGQTGALDPVRSAVESGRFEEMDESTDAERARLDAQDAADEVEALREVKAVRARRGEQSSGAREEPAE